MTDESRTRTNCTDERTDRSCESERTDSRKPTGDRLLVDEPVTEATLPRDVRTSLGRFVGTESIETIGDWLAECRRLTGDGGPIGIEDLCHVDERTGHWGELDGRRYDFACFYDAVALSALVGRPVDIRTESPTGTVIEARAVGTDELTVTPTGAVFSFGIDERAARGADDESTGAGAEADPEPEDVYAAVCPYVKAFPDAAAYERWAPTVPAATVAMPLEGATELAAELVG